MAWPRPILDLAEPMRLSQTEAGLGEGSARVGLGGGLAGEAGDSDC